MIQPREDLPFRCEARERQRPAQAATDEFDRDFLLVLVVSAHGTIDLAHAAGSEHGDDLVGTEPLPDHLLRRRTDHRLLHGRLFQKSARLARGLEQRLDFRANTGRIGTRTREKFGSASRIKVEAGVEQRLRALPFRGALHSFVRWKRAVENIGEIDTFASVATALKPPRVATSVPDLASFMPMSPFGLRLRVIP